MTFKKANPMGWVDGVNLLTAEELNTLDQQQANAIDGSDGGIYTLQNDIQLGGAGLEMGSVTRMKIAPRTVDVFIPMRPRNRGSVETRYIDRTPTNGGEFAVMNHFSPDNTNIYLPKLPAGATITYITVWYKGAAGHAADPPNINFPYFRLWRHTGLHLGNTGYTLRYDNVTSRALYEALHSWTAAPSTVPVVVDRSFRYYLQLMSESGADYIQHGKFYGAMLSLYISSLDEV